MGIDHASPPLKKLGSFEILRELGQGGMGVVYLARQPALDRLVVLKKARQEMLTDPSLLERFQREARAAAAVHQQNVVAVYDCFSARGDHYIAQEFVDGVDLQVALTKTRPLDANVAAMIALEVVRGLEEIHAQGIVHRDLKPGNILLGCGGEVKIADFGIALEGMADGLTRPGTILGSLPYMSPEQMLGERVDYRSDLFLLGVLLYEMVTGVPPFKVSEEASADTLLERIQKGRFESPRRLAGRTPGYIVRLIRRCLRAKPSRRIQSATLARRYLERQIGRVSPADCRREIARFLWQNGVLRESEERTQVRPAPQTPPRLWQGMKSRWLIPLVSAGFLVMIVVGIGSFGFGLLRDSPDAAVPPAETLSASLEPEASPAAVVPAQPAQVRFVAYPWAEISTEDGMRFLTPRAEPLAMEPGRHRITFDHPRFGRAEYVIDVRAGEERTVHHVFDEAPGP